MKELGFVHTPPTDVRIDVTVRIADALRKIGITDFSPRILATLALLNGDRAHHFDYELASAEAVYSCSDELAGQGYDPDLIIRGLLLSDIGKAAHPAVAKVYLAGEISRDVLDLPVREAIRSAGVSLSDDDVRTMIELGFDPHTVPIGVFYTTAHLSLGRHFLLQERVPVTLQRVALSHHFSQGYHELAPEEISSDNYLLRHIAVLECLDKVETGITRRRKSLEDSISFSKLLVRNGLKANYTDGHYADLWACYEKTFDLLEESKVFSCLD